MTHNRPRLVVHDDPPSIPGDDAARPLALLAVPAEDEVADLRLAALFGWQVAARSMYGIAQRTPLERAA